MVEGGGYRCSTRRSSHRRQRTWSYHSGFLCDFQSYPGLIVHFGDGAIVRASVVRPQVLYDDGEVSSLVLVWEADHTTFKLRIYFILSAVDDVQHNFVILVPPEGADRLGQLFRVDAGQEDLITDEAGYHRLAAGQAQTRQQEHPQAVTCPATATRH